MNLNLVVLKLVVKLTIVKDRHATLVALLVATLAALLAAILARLTAIQPLQARLITLHVLRFHDVRLTQLIA